MNISGGGSVQPDDERQEGEKVNKIPASFRLGSLFSGIGGLDLGLEMSLGARPVFFCEQEPFCHAVLQSRCTGPLLFDDVRELGVSTPVPGIDVLCGGFPCQDVSHAGKNAGLAGARSGLWFEMLRVLGLARPAYVVVENVSALLNRGLGTVLQGLHEHGYAAEWQIIEALSVGALHIRARVFIVAYPDTNDTPTIFHPNCLSMEYVFNEHRSRLWAKEPTGVSRTVTSAEMPPRQRRARLKALGNAVVHQAAEVVGMAIAESIINPWHSTRNKYLGRIPDVSKFPKSGLSRNGFVYETAPLYTSAEKWAWHEAQRGPLVDLARGIAPTPTVGDASSSGSRNTPSSKAHAGVTLTDVARGDAGRGRGLVPTPRAEDSESSGARISRGVADTLTAVVRLNSGIVPTPRASDHRSGKTSEATANKNARPLCEIVGNRPSEKSGHLNPEWVEWLMGFPLGWTDVPVPPPPPRRRK